MNTVSAFAMGEAHFKECQLVHEFINLRVRPRVFQAAEAARCATTDTFAGALLRVISWLRSLWKLNEPADFQACTVASRTLFEIAVDLTILRLDPGNPPAKLLAWEESAKLKTAAAFRDYKNRRGEPLPADAPQLGFIARNEARITGLRGQYWSGRHPTQRWTGRNLREDAASATGLFAEGNFEEFYEERHAQACWNTHGSGLTGLRWIQAEHFPGLTMLAFRDSAHFALVAAEMVLRHFGLWESEIFGEFEAHRKDRVLVKYATMSGLSVEELKRQAGLA